MKQIRCFDIQWETDGIEVEIPTEVIVEVSDDCDLDNDCGEIADALSNKTGWLVLTTDAEAI